MENITIKDAVLEKKMDGYYFNGDNFKATQELTVEITLAEYRQLVSDSATRKDAIDKANADKYSREAEIEDLKKQVNELKAENYELKKMVEKAGEDSDGVD